jgi:hypothetical protein
MPSYKRTAVIAKQGVNFVRSVVEGAGSLFHKIDQENDLGIDALFELVKDDRPLNEQIAVQIKSGQSYYNAESGECVFPVEAHREYWTKHPLRVFGIVFVPTLETAYWVDIKHYLRLSPDRTIIRYRASEANRFDSSSFGRLFVPAVIGGTPALSLSEADVLARSENNDEQYLGLLVMFRRYPNVLSVWDQLVRFFVERPVGEIPRALVYWLAHIPWHSDIAHFGEAIAESTRAYARTLLSKFDYPEVVKLLGFIDRESSISRGSIGQSVEAIVSSLPRSREVLHRVIVASDLDMFLRECAALILAMNEGPEASGCLTQLAKAGSWYATEIISRLRDHGSVNPYA